MTEFTEKFTEYEVEVFYRGEPQYIVGLTEQSAEDACRRAKTAIWMKALKDGREWEKDEITTRIYEPPPEHDCEASAVPYESDGALGHGWCCGVCGKFLQAG